MNANRHRIVFNRAHGLFMAVPQGDLLRGIAESASTQGKSPAGGSGTTTATPPGFSLARLRSAAFAALLACGAQLALMPLATAQVVAYKAAPASQKPTVLTAGNGVPLINIQTPSAAGVSRNTYEQFDVQAQGAILNNSRTNAQTQLGGWVQGNPWLAGGSARVILNEVISANPSQLLGYVEVAGSAAQVVIANPAGVTCNGCGFINASRATLTTGSPIVSGGNLEGYRVEGGTVRIEGSGMDASRVGYTDLIARAVEVNAGLWAQTLKVTAGSNVVSADHTQAAPISGSGAAPAFAIDVAQLGGMYAGKITLVGTEAGVGVRNAGILGASAGEVVVTADGRLTNSGSILARSDIALTTPGEVRNTGLVSAGGILAITAANVTNANTLNASQGLEGQALTINTDTIDNRSGALRANAALTINSSGSLDNSGGLISSAQNIDVRDTAATKTLAIANTAGTFIADQRLAIDSASLTGDGKLLSQGDLAVRLVADYTHTGELTANGRASLETAGALINQATMQAGTALTLTAATIDNRATGQIAAPELTLAATSTHAAQQVPLGDTLTNRGLIDGGDTRIDAIALNNLGTGRIYGNHLAITATTLTNEAETVNGVTSAPVIASRDRLDLAVGTLNNREGALIFSAGDMAIGGTLDGANRATGQAGTINNASATIEALGNLTLNASTINNTNEHFSTQLVSVGSVLMDEWAISGGARYAPNEVTLSWTSAPGVTYYPAATDGRNWMGSQGFFADNSNNYVFLSTPSGTSGNFWVYSFTRSTQEDQVLTSSPGKITAGADMAISASTLKNDNSHILAGGNLAGTFGSVINTATPGQRTVTDSGTAWNIYQDTKHDDSDGNSYAYNPAPSTGSFSLSVARREGNTAPGGSGTTLGAQNVGSLVQRATGSSLFRNNPAPGGSYLIEADPRFASYRQWLSSDYMLKALALDPATIQKRLGDGFYEQRLLTEQIAQLTGRRFLAGYQNEEDQYRALMTTGITYARDWQLIPGVALTPEQMARLTTDMVWLVEKEVTLADGSKQKALVPQLYARTKEGDLAPAGGLLADKTLDLQVQGNLTNLGTLAGRQLVSLTAENLQNLGGRITGEDVWLTARQDLQMRGGQVDAGNRLDAYAGRNLDIASTTRNGAGQTSVDRLASLYVQNPGGTLKLAAAGDINLIAAQLQSAGTTDIQAGNNLNLGTVTTAYANSVGNGKNSRQESGSREVGTTIQSNGNLTLQAGNNLTARAADATSTNGKLLATAGNDLRIEAGTSTLNISEQHKTTSKGFLSKKTTTTRDTLNDINAIASTLSGDTTTLIADRDIAIKGSNVVGTNDTTLIATRNLTIEAAAETHNETHVSKTKQSGAFSSGTGFTIGSKQQRTDQKTDATRVAKSTVGSTGGNVLLLAGETYKQVGSDVIAPKGNIDIAAKQVDIVEARETSRTVTEQKSKQSGLTLAVSSPVITAVQTAQQMSQAAADTKDGRMKALAAANTGLTAKNAVDAVVAGQGSTVDGKPNQLPVLNENGDVTGYRDANAADQMGGINISLSIGSSKSSSKTTQTSNTAVASNLTAGRDISIEASGAGKDSDITLQGAKATAARNLTLAAADEIKLLAASNTADQHSTNKNSSASLGIGFSLGGQQNGFTIQAGVSGGKGKANGNDLFWSNTQVEAGNVLMLASGGDTTIKGATAKGEQVRAQIGGNLSIESLQDTSTYDSQQKSLGASVSLCIPPFCYGAASSGSISASASKIKSDYASVTEQSAIKAGDSGFQVNAQGDTTLKGGAITSTQAAIDHARNNFKTDGELTLSDIQNKADYSAKSASINLGTGFSPTGALIPQGTSAGFGKDSGSASSATQAAISGVAGNAAARTGDAEMGIQKIFDQQQVQKEIDAQMKITQIFGQQASKAISDYTTSQRKVLQEQIKNAGTPEEKAQAEQSLKEVNMQERALNILVGALTGMAGSAVSKEVLSAAAEEMRDLMIKDSIKFEGAVDSTGKVLSNISGPSEGVRGDGAKVGGTRVDLDLLCGPANERCKTNEDGNLALDSKGRVQFDNNKAGMTLDEFINTPQGQKMSGDTGGIQGYKGTLFGVPYEAGSWQDKLIEAFSGSHDMIGGKISGLYDDQGNIRRGMSDAERAVYDKVVTVGAIPVAAPFAMAEILPPNVWNAVGILLRAAR